MYTHMGFEFTKSKDNWNYSRSMMFNYGGPFFHTGMGVGYAILPEKLNSTFYILNGWDGRVSGEQNQSSTLGWNVNWTPSSNFVMNYNLISGSETSDNEAIRQVHEVNASYSVTSSVTVAFDYLTGIQKRSVVTPAVLDTKWSGMAAYLRYKAHPSFSGTLRYEIFDDTNGATLPGGGGFYTHDSTKSQKVSAITATVGTQLAEGLDLRLEYRSDSTDKVDTGIFRDRNGSNTSKQDTVSVSVLATF
ncbi:MAG: porin [Bdellovibrionales bacterium]|nr:porin [Bdellovibrionales bacterium]